MKAVKAKKLWNELMDADENPTNDNLRYVIEYVKSLRFEARKMLKTPKRSMEEVMKDIRDL